MIVYLLIILILFVGVYNKSARFYYVIGLTGIIAISILREPSMAGDFPNYERIFHDAPSLEELHKYGTEKLSEYTFGYVFLNSVVKSFSNDYIAFQFLHAIVSILLLYIIISRLKFNYKEKCFLLLAIFCYSYLWYFWNILRQNIANLLFWLFLIWYYSYCGKKNIKYYFYILAGLALPTFFHTSAFVNFILFPIMIVVGKIPPRKRLKIILPFSITIYILSSFVFDSLLNVMANIIDPRYSMYLDSGAGNGNIINYGLKIFFYLLFSLNYSTERYKLKKMVLDGLTMVILLSSVNQELLNRVYEYYAICLYISFVFITHYFSNPYKKIVSILFIMALSVIFIRFIHISCDGMFLNYKTWL